MTIVEYADVIYTAVVRSNVLTDGTPWFIAEHPKLPGCVSDGPTEAEALSNLKDARAEYIGSLIQDGLEVPVPANKSEVNATVTAASS